MDINIEQIVRDYLPEVIHMSLATARQDQPWVCEVHYAYDDDLNFFFRSLTSRRHSQEIAHNSKVAGNIVKQHEKGQYPLGVYFEGTAQLLEPGPARQHAYETMNTRFGFGPDILKQAANPDGHQFYQINVSNWYVFGKLDGESGKKYQLAWKGTSNE